MGQRIDDRSTKLSALTSTLQAIKVSITKPRSSPNAYFSLLGYAKQGIYSDKVLNKQYLDALFYFIVKHTNQQNYNNYKNPSKTPSRFIQSSVES